MLKFQIIISICLFSFPVLSQNDIDAMRYSQTFFGGSSRSKAMAGSFGALGADGSCMGNNPAGIGLYKKGDINFSFGLKFNSITASHNETTTKDFKVNLPFDGLTLVGAWDSKTNKDSHHALGLACNQVSNFNSLTSISGISNHKSIMQDVLATAGNNSIKNLDASFAGLAYEVYLLDTINSNYYSLVNTKYNVTQSKIIETSGRNNEWCINYAYGFKDKLYIGATLGISNINYNYSSVYKESDDNDSIKSTNYSYPVWYYPSDKVGGFKALEYKETFRTIGSGYNLKLGVIYRASDFIRVGASFHTPTIYNLTDTYVYNMSASYDEGGSFTSQNPPNPGGKYNYKVVTPMKFTGSLALLYKKFGALNIDYDILNYNQAYLQSSDASVFSGINQTIKNKYSQASNLRIGAEANLKPVFVRFGYAMYGSPFGETFTGSFVNSFYTGGIGIRNNKTYLDLSFTRRINSENYYLYNSNYVDKSIIKNSITTIAITLGSKF
jgi:hypothetical protein